MKKVRVASRAEPSTASGHHDGRVSPARIMPREHPLPPARDTLLYKRMDAEIADTVKALGDQYPKLAIVMTGQATFVCWQTDLNIRFLDDTLQVKPHFASEIGKHIEKAEDIMLYLGLISENLLIGRKTA